MSTATIDPRVLRAAKWFATNGWKISVDHSAGAVTAALPGSEGPLVINVIALVTAVVGH